MARLEPGSTGMDQCFTTLDYIDYVNNCCWTTKVRELAYYVAPTSIDFHRLYKVYANVGSF